MTAMTSKWLYSSKLFQALNFFTKDDLLTKVISSNQSSISQNVGPHCSQILLNNRAYYIVPHRPCTPRRDKFFRFPNAFNKRQRELLWDDSVAKLPWNPRSIRTFLILSMPAAYLSHPMSNHLPPPATLNNDITTYSSHPHNLLQHDDIRQHDVKCLFTWNRDHEKSREIGHFCYHEFTWFSFVIPWSVQLLNKVLFWDILVLKITEINTNPCQIYPLLSSSMQWVVGNQ